MSTRKVTELLVKSDQNLGINKIPIARPGLQNMIFYSHKNKLACKSTIYIEFSASYAHFGKIKKFSERKISNSEIIKYQYF